MTSRQRKNPYLDDTPRTSTSDGAQQDTPEKKTLLSGLSVSQVVASALAAVTSMLLSSQIGIAGSVIGVAVGSVVATVCSQLYKGVLNASAEKIKGAHPLSDASDVTTQADQAQTTSASPYYADEDTLTRVSRHTADGRAASGTPIAPANLRSAAADRHKRTVAIRVAVVAVLAGLVAVGLTALVINLVTSGSGLGTKTGTVFEPPAATTQVEPETRPATTSAATSATTSATTSPTTSATTGGQATTGGSGSATTSEATTSGSGSTATTGGSSSGSSSAATTSGTATTEKSAS